MRVRAYFAHLSIDYHLENIARVGSGTAAGREFASFVGNGSCRRPFWCNVFTVLTINSLLHELFQLLGYLIRVVLDLDYHAVAG